MGGVDCRMSRGVSVFLLSLSLVLPSRQETDCGGPLKPEVVWSTQLRSYDAPATSVLVLGDEDRKWSNGTANYWLAGRGKTQGQGFTIKVDSCERIIAGFQIKNKGKGADPDWVTKAFRVSSSLAESGPWEILVEDEFIDTRGQTPAALLNFTFQPKTIQFLKFDLISFWQDHSSYGGGLQYFTPVPADCKESG